MTTVAPFETHFVADETTAKKMTRVAVINFMTRPAMWVGLFILSLLPIFYGLAGGYTNTRHGRAFASNHRSPDKSLVDAVTTYIATVVLLLVTVVVTWIVLYFRMRKTFTKGFPAGTPLTLRFDEDRVYQDYGEVQGWVQYLNVRKIFRRREAVVVRTKKGPAHIVIPQELFTDDSIEFVRRNAGLNE